MPCDRVGVHGVTNMAKTLTAIQLLQAEKATHKSTTAVTGSLPIATASGTKRVKVPEGVMDMGLQTALDAIEGQEAVKVTRTIEGSIDPKSGKPLKGSLTGTVKGDELAPIVCDQYSDALASETAWLDQLAAWEAENAKQQA